MGDNRYKERHRNKGLCVNCGEPVEVKGQRFCKIHRERQRLWAAAYREKMKAEGRCVTCGQPLPLTGRESNQTCVNHMGNTKTRTWNKPGREVTEATREHFRGERSK